MGVAIKMLLMITDLSAFEILVLPHSATSIFMRLIIESKRDMASLLGEMRTPRCVNGDFPSLKFKILKILEEAKVLNH